MIISDARNPVAFPEQVIGEPIQGKNKNRGEDAIDFDSMLSNSNMLKQTEIDKEKKLAGKDEYHIGETKDDKEFRQQLEKITGKKQDKLKNKLDQNDYLTLMVTQLKYQDPSKPMEHTEMASQMAQFNTVEQLVGVNKSLTNLTKSQNEAKLDKLSQYLDKYVEVQGNKLKLNFDKTTSIARFELPLTASSVTLEIKDLQGKSIRSIPLGRQEIGSHNVNWDGKDKKGNLALPGEYQFVVHAATVDGKEITSKGSFLAKVNGVTDLASGGKLDTSAGSVDPAKIIAIRNYESKTQEVKKSPAQVQNKSPAQVQNKSPAQEVKKSPVILKNSINKGELNGLN